MKRPRKHAPESLPQAVNDLVAEGGNVLASDDALVGGRDIGCVLTRRLHLSKSGRWVTRMVKS